MSALLEVRDLAFAYPGQAARRARPFSLAGISFGLGAGEVLGVIGPNSAGKTTLVRLLTRVLRPAAGEVRLDGRPLDRLARWEVARRIAVVPQEAPRPFPFTVAELALMGRYPHAPGRYFERAEDLAAAGAAMAATGVLELAELPFGELSGGERQRALLARALAQEPRVLVLDEPTAHLDLRFQAETAALLRRINRERGVSVLLVSHDLGLAAELCDRLLLLAEGRIARLGAPAEVLEPEILGRAFGCPVVVDKSPTTSRPLVQVLWRPEPEGR